MHKDMYEEDEENRANLISGDAAKVSMNRSTFDIDDSNSATLRHPAASVLSINKCYLYALCVSILLVVLYFSMDVHSLFRSSAGTVIVDINSNRMKESELKALYLLRQQKSELMGFWNHNLYSNSSIENHVSLADLKSVMLRQNLLNDEIQRVLLSSHQSENSEELEGNHNFSLHFIDHCQKVEKELSGRRTIQWKPNPNKFLFAICVSGQMSNHLICLEKHMFFAAILNRILVIPSSKFDYQYNTVLDIDHINDCVGRKVVVPFEDFHAIKENHTLMVRFICYFSLPQPCYIDEEHVNKLKALGISIGKIESAWTEDAKKPSRRTVKDIKSKFAYDDDVLTLGDVFYADLEKEWTTQPGGLIAHGCKTLIEPSRLILVTAQRFIQTFLGKNFIALHFRRHGFLKFCNAKSPSCFFPIPQAADCISRVVEMANAPIIYLSTDSAPSETNLLQALVTLNGKPVPLFKRPDRNSAEKWDALLYRHGLEQDAQVEAMLDKAICAMSNVFIGSAGSTFTEDILRLRKDWGSSSVCDEYLCQGEQPNFIAENE